ncbi:MAG: efflux RND transporter periplasmic adaptor subunit [Pirellulales bacterium]
MATALRLDQVDDLLDSLETAARSNVSVGTLFGQLLGNLRNILRADSAAIFVPHAEKGILWLAHSGAPLGPIADEVSEACTANRADNPADPVKHFTSKTSPPSWFAVPVRPGKFSKGGLVLAFRSPPPPAAIAGIWSLLTAFAEIVSMRQLADLERFMDNHWDRLHNIYYRVTECADMREVASLLADELVPILGASRVTVAADSTLGGKSNLLASSSVSSVDRRSETGLALQALSDECFQAKRPIIRRDSEDEGRAESNAESLRTDGTFRNLVALPLSIPDRAQGSRIVQAVLIVEWLRADDLLASAPIVSHVAPMLTVSWRQQSRWLRLPEWTRRAAATRLHPSRSLRRWIKPAIALGIGAVAFYILTMPSTLRIEAEAVLEPVHKKSVFSNADGYVDALFVEDGQSVVEGEKLLQLRSPELSLRMEELLGELRTIAEKRNGLRVALNQINLGAAGSAADQGRISSDIAQLDTQEATTQAKLKLVREESQKLLIKGTMTGQVVGRDLDQTLLSRPVRRGDALFELVDLNGPWHLKVRLPDSDSGYVLDEYRGAESNRLSMEYVFDSLPDERFQTQVDWVARSAENPLGQGSVIEARAPIDTETAHRLRMGAQARVYFVCGRRPLWFVWCRPLIELLQRKLWLSSL